MLHSIRVAFACLPLCFFLFLGSALGTSAHIRTRTHLGPALRQPLELLPSSEVHSAGFVYDAAVTAAERFSHQWVHRSHDVRVLFVSTMHHYLNNMDRFLYKVIDAAMGHPQVQATTWGPGWQGYNSSLSLQANHRDKYGCGSFDVIFAKLGAFTGETTELGDVFTQWEAYEPCPGETLVEELADCHELACLDHPGHKAGHVITSRFAMILPELFFPGGMDPPKMFAHIPDCADPNSALPVPWADKLVNATQIGHTWEGLYPMRGRMAAAISHGLIPGAGVYKHPGYPANEAAVAPALYMPHHAAVAAAEAQIHAYLRAISQSRVCLFDSSVVRKGLAKFFEAMMGGCVPASDLPLEMEDILRDAMIVLDVADSEQQIAAKVNAALADPEELQRKAALGMHLARQHFTCEGKLDRILSAAAEHAAGFRGFQFPYGFRIGCHTYFTSDHRPANSWCQ